MVWKIITEVPEVSADSMFIAICPENGGSRFFRNISTIYRTTLSYSRRLFVIIHCHENVTSKFRVHNNCKRKLNIIKND
jgi:hypothetical protein